MKETLVVSGRGQITLPDLPYEYSALERKYDVWRRRAKANSRFWLMVGSAWWPTKMRRDMCVIRKNVIDAILDWVVCYYQKFCQRSRETRL